MQDLVRDITLAVRGALRRPGYALAVVATLAIGIGATTAIYSVFNWILLRPLPGVTGPAELVTIRYQTPRRSGSFFVTYRDYADLRDNVTGSLHGIAAAAPRRMDLSIGGEPRPIAAEVVTVNYLSVLGVSPIRGRDFERQEEQPGGPASLLISERLWKREFAAREDVVGRTVQLNGRPFTIVGITPDAFQGRSMITPAEAWLSISGHTTLQPPGADLTQFLTSRRETLFGDAIARLRPGASVEQAQAEAAAVAAAIPEFATAFSAPGARSEIGPVVYPGVGHETTTRDRLTTMFRLLMGAVGLLLLLSCANAANLLLARATTRSREIAVCQAIGASRFRIVRQQLVEGLVLASAAGALGLVLAVWLTSLFDGMRIISFLPAVSGIGVDWRVATFALLASLVTGLLFAAVPAIAGSRVDLQSSLKDGAGASRGRRRTVRHALVTLQVTVSVVLLVAAGLFIRTLQNVRGLDLGFRPEGVVSAGVQPGRFGLDPKRSAVYLRDLLEGVRQAPGITSAAFSWTTSFSANRGNLVVVNPAAPETPITANQTTVSPGFFETMGIPVLAGRDFTAADTSVANDTSELVIISRSFAEAAFPDGAAIGSRLTRPRGKGLEVIGVVGDVRDRAVTNEPEPWAYLVAADPSWGTLLVRSPLPDAQVIATIRDVARGIDPVVSPHDIETFGAAVDRALSEQRLFARVSGVFAAIGALLAGIGIYGMLSGAVAERRKEFGIRLALGANGPAIIGLVLRSSAGLAIAGLALGLGTAAALRRFVESRLYGVTGDDPTTIAATIVAILTLSLLASLIPAARAARVDPVRSLRVD